MSHRAVHLRRRNRQGVIFITALGIIVILTGLVLVFAQSMRTEAAASAFRLSSAQADAIEQGAEQWVMGQIDTYPANAVQITEVPAEAIPLGAGYFWILHVDPTQDQQYSFGITDECSKANINANPTLIATNFVNLPGLTQDVVDNMISWTAGASYPTGAQSDYYEALQEPYQTRFDQFGPSPYETVEELLMVENLTPQILYGTDLNHNGVIELAEQNAAGTMTIQTGPGADSRGLFNYVTCYSVDPPGGVAPSGNTVASINDQNALRPVLTQALTASRANTILNNVQRASRGRPMPSLAAFQQAAGLQAADWGKVFDQLTTGQNRTGLVNVNTASEQALMAIGIPQGDASTIVAQRTNADLTTSAWFFNTLPSDLQSQLPNLLQSITGRSFQYSADIVAVSGDGRSFKRVRIVVDSRTAPSKIVYRKDLTSLGWPLDPEIRIAMRAGHPPPDVTQIR